jgi:hypothetical protein
MVPCPASVSNHFEDGVNSATRLKVTAVGVGGLDLFVIHLDLNSTLGGRSYYSGS